MANHNPLPVTCKKHHIVLLHCTVLVKVHTWMCARALHLVHVPFRGAGIRLRAHARVNLRHYLYKIVYCKKAKTYSLPITK